MAADLSANVGVGVAMDNQWTDEKVAQDLWARWRVFGPALVSQKELRSFHTRFGSKAPDGGFQAAFPAELKIWCRAQRLWHEKTSALPHTSLKVLAALLFCNAISGGTRFPTHEVLADAACCGRATVHPALVALEQAGLLRRSGRQYTFNN
jgi:hypothetical protein